MKIRKGKNDDGGADDCIDDAVELELFARYRELAVDRQHQEGVEFSGAHKFRDIGDVDEKERLKDLPDNLMGADEQNHFPFRPVADPVDVGEDDAEEHNLSD